MRLLTHPELIDFQQDLETSLNRFAVTDLRQATADVTEPAVYDAARVYLTRPSKRLLGMAFLVSHYALAPRPRNRDDLLALATTLEVRHAAILLHDDIVDRDTMRGGQPTAHQALTAAAFRSEGPSAAIFAGDILAALTPLPLLRSGLAPADRIRLTDITLALTARVAAGQTEQLHLDTARALEDTTETEILRTHSTHFHPYMNCSLHLAAALAGLPEAHIERILAATVPIAQAFQVQNDLAGFTELEKQLASTKPSSMTLANTSDLARRRRTTLVRAAFDHLSGDDRARLVAYINGHESAHLKDIVDLVWDSGAVEHCQSLITRLFAQAREAIADDRYPSLPCYLRDRVLAVWRYMTDLYDQHSDVSRLYLKARPDIAPTLKVL